ncbi:MAG: rRNA maturation RNase YbeY [Bacteroidota bacterium]|nr:rRNA maturation RNase YbeY [Bacteroidota bacterium]
MISFHYQNDFEPLNNVVYNKWLSAVIASENKALDKIDFVFCSDDYLHEMNKQFLDQDTFTDIITFDYCEENRLSGEIYISTDRVADNAQVFNVNFEQELHRVLVHGILHLCGYKDKSPQEIDLMRSKEEEKMNMFHVKH